MVNTGQQSVRGEAARLGVAGGTGCAAYEGHEAYEGGSPEAEWLRFQKLAHELMRMRRYSGDTGGTDGSGAPRPPLAFHGEAALGVENARLRFRDDLPPELCVGYARPGAEYPAVVRLSSASGSEGYGATPDLRRLAVRVQAGPEETHDLLATSFPVSHAADAHEFVAFAKATARAGSTVEKAFGLFVRLPLAVGWATADRMRRNMRIATRHTVGSLARETFWSRGAILWGPAGPVRYQLRPAPGGTPAPPPDGGDPDYLHRELAMRLATGDIAFELCVQRYLDDRRTPVEDGSVEWRESDAPVVPVAVLTVPRQDLDGARARSTARRVEQLTFNPWHTTEEFRPLGNLNRARKAAYEAAAAHRLGPRFPAAEQRPTALLPVPVRAAFDLPVRAAFGLVDRWVPWHRLPAPLGLLNPAAALGRSLRRFGLVEGDDAPEAPRRPAPAGERPRVARSYPAVARRDVAGAASGGGLRLKDGHLPPGRGGAPPIGPANTWWLGLGAMHTLFAREHDAVREALCRTHPTMSEESAHHAARLVVSALIAKIHTVERITEILATGMSPEMPFALAEEFMAVYRTHPLLPDGVELCDHVVDLARARRRGVPRYDDFRARLGTSPLRSFEGLAPGPDAVARLESVRLEAVWHCPQLAGVLPRGAGPFAPWRPVVPSRS
ncbi:peroxidase family protein [Streptomyces sp. Inha503]|uniref:peroxidase family protein n=1 Tax=Streptomyces sp. Inha503 TaxID=3383314 RepID=UPI0039A3D1F9